MRADATATTQRIQRKKRQERDKKGEGKGKSEGKNRLMEYWDKSWFTQGTGPDGQTKPMCMRDNLSQCTSQRCAFVHSCPVPKSDGSICGSTDHKAITCPHRSRRVSALGQLPALETATSVGRPWPKPHYVSAITEGCKQHSRPAKAQRTDPTISLDLPSGPTSPLSVTLSKFSASITHARTPAKYCFEIFAGRSAFLSVAANKSWARSPGTPELRPPARWGDARPYRSKRC